MLEMMFAFVVFAKALVGAICVTSFAARPVLMLLFPQAKFAPTTFEAKSVGSITSPGHTEMSGIGVKTGFG